jgi:hypothetical protein
MSRATEYLENIINGHVDSQTYTDTLSLRLSTTYLPLPATPVTAVSSVKVAGVTVNAGDANGYTLDTFGLRRKYGYSWPANTAIEVSWTCGWASGVYPDDISAALGAYDEWIATSPLQGITEYEEGGQRVKKESVSSEGLGELIRTLVKRWIRHIC